MSLSILMNRHMLLKRFVLSVLIVFSLLIAACGIPATIPILDPPEYLSGAQGELSSDLKFFFEHPDAQPAGFRGYDIYYKWYHGDNLSSFTSDMENLLASPLSRSRVRSRGYTRFRGVEDGNELQQPSIRVASTNERYLSTDGQSEDTVQVHIYPSSLNQESTREIDLYRSYSDEKHGITTPIDVTVDDDQVTVANSDFNSAVRSYIRDHVQSDSNPDEVTLKLGIFAAAYGLSVQMDELYSPLVYPQTENTLFEVTLAIQKN